MVNVWVWAEVLDGSLDGSRVKPFRQWSEHSLAVRDLFVQGDLGVAGRVISASDDRTCKVTRWPSNKSIICD